MTTIFLIGPGGVGKSTVGKLLAKKLGYLFIDQDHLFKLQHGELIPFIMQHSEAEYTAQNYLLLKSVLKELKNKDMVIAMSPSSFTSGIHSTDRKTARVCKKHGTIVLMLPSRFPGVDVQRLYNQVKDRDYTTSLQHTKMMYLSWVNLYKRSADLTVFVGRSSLTTMVRRIIKGITPLLK